MGTLVAGRGGNGQDACRDRLEEVQHFVPMHITYNSYDKDDNQMILLTICRTQIHCTSMRQCMFKLTVDNDFNCPFSISPIRVDFSSAVV